MSVLQLILKVFRVCKFRQPENVEGSSSQIDLRKMSFLELHACVCRAQE
jgi:hypothetical protein